MPATLASAASWVLLTLGGALFAGTAAALVTYRRTGRLPGDADAAARPGVLRYAVVKCLVGLVAGALGLVGLQVYGTAV